ncbi:MAG TPA: glutamine--fructose-6-phosphate transaminase (isomerizing) [Fluviicoccus sp.]|nr:glutamine--fructose-6-phosphate transaminase (isomerizing) [Fluviicoccus sp.]
MCGIVGAVAQRNVTDILINGLKHLEYRGYDSAGLAVLDHGEIKRERQPGKVIALQTAAGASGINGLAGIAHTRWATHGAPTRDNAHPHVSGDIAVVHNGIIENHERLREFLENEGFVFTSQTDTEVIAHLLQFELRESADLLSAVKRAMLKLEGSCALCILRAGNADCLIAARRGSPLVIGMGYSENFVGSDLLALQGIAHSVIFMEEGDIAEITSRGVTIYDNRDQKVVRSTPPMDLLQSAGDKGQYRHYMLKEIYEQPRAIQRTLEGRLSRNHLHSQAFGAGAWRMFSQVRHVQIIACGTSYHAGSVARYWLEQRTGVTCSVEVASEFRYRKHVLPPNTLVVALSQSGETADTLGAIQIARRSDILGVLGICNVPTSSLVRESDFHFITHAGPEIGVASTKAFTTQLVALMLLTLSIGRSQNTITLQEEIRIARHLQSLPVILESVLALDNDIAAMARDFADRQHTLFLGRGEMYPLAQEGALKLKEISYIHAEAYAAGELKHGPLALVDQHMPIVAIAPRNSLIDKLKSNLQEVRARGGQLYIFADRQSGLKNEPGIKVFPMPTVAEEIAPIVYSLPLQLLAYHVAIVKGTDVDQPRNLAKSVTVE